MRKCLMLLALLFSGQTLQGITTYQVTPLQYDGDPIPHLWGYHLNNKGSVAGEAHVDGKRNPFIWLSEGRLELMDLPSSEAAWARVQALSEDDRILTVGPLEMDPFYLPYHLWSSDDGLTSVASDGEPRYRQYCQFNPDGSLVGDYKLGGDLIFDEAGDLIVNPVSEYGLCQREQEGELCFTPLSIEGGAGTFRGRNASGTYLFQLEDRFQLFREGAWVKPEAAMDWLLPWGLNNHGLVIGSAYWLERYHPHLAGAFVWGEEQGMVLLDSYLDGNGQHSYVAGINDSDQVVGSVSSSDRTRDYAFSWSSEEGLLDLNQLITSRKWILRKATAINDGGQILCLAEDQDGNLQTVILTPKED